jgi:hypothetical protein
MNKFGVKWRKLVCVTDPLTEEEMKAIKTAEGMGWQSSSSGSVPALKVQSLEFKPRSCPPEKDSGFNS